MATGRLLPPVMAAATKASWMRIYAEKENLNLSDCYAYSDSMSDLPMLSVVGHPTAVNPDFRLRGTAASTTGPFTARPAMSGPRSRRQRAPKIFRGPTSPAQGRRPGRLHRHRFGAAGAVLGRGPAARGPADRHAGDLPEAAHRGPGQPGRRHPLRPQPPAGGRAAVRAAHAGDAGHHRGRRHQPAAAADGARPDIRQTILEILLEMLAANGVDDVHIIVANSLHRRMTEAEMKRMVGARSSTPSTPIATTTTTPRIPTASCSWESRRTTSR